MIRKLWFLFVLFTLIGIWGTGHSVADEPPAVTHGPISGEITANSVVLWARAGWPGTLTFEVADNADFEGALISATVDVDGTTDLTGEVAIEGLQPATQYHYRVQFGGEGVASDYKAGTFRTAPAVGDAAPLSFVFGACLGGQGYCRNPETGWLIFDQMTALDPDFFLFTGDTIYADSACSAEQNVPGAEELVSDLDGFRARYRYHLEDSHYAAFLANTPVFATWDDHEIIDNFGGQEVQRINPDLFADGLQAFSDYWPVTGVDASSGLYRQFNYGANADVFLLDTRSFRDPLVNWDPSPVNMQHKTMLGEEQFAWLTAGLADSDATWKFIVSSVPLSYPTGWPQPEVDGRDGWANGADRSGYETELMTLLFFIEAHDIDNVVFITGDAHWPYAISYDPDRDGEPNFYEVSSSPLSALPLPPAEPDQTFNPTVLYAEGEFAGDLFNFGHIAVAEDGSLQFRVVDWTGAERFTLDLMPQ